MKPVKLFENLKSVFCFFGFCILLKILTLIFVKGIS